LKICVVTGTFHPEPGGPSTYLYNLLGDLVQRGHEVAVITYGDLEEEYDYTYPVMRISRRQPIPVRLIEFVYHILSIGRRYDLLFVNNYGLPAVVANAFLRKPMAIKLAGDFAWEYSIRHVTPLSELQQCILALLGPPASIYENLTLYANTIPP